MLIRPNSGWFDVALREQPIRVPLFGGTLLIGYYGLREALSHPRCR